MLEVAKQAGHSPTMALTTYGHVIEELEGAINEDILPLETVSGIEGSMRWGRRSACSLRTLTEADPAHVG